MSAILTIARRDLRSYVSAPKGGAIFWFFILTMGIFFLSYINTYMEAQQNPQMYGGQAPEIDQLLRALFQLQQFVLLLVIPAVTMSTFAEEKRNHSIRLLQSAPISPMQIVFGKFFAVAGMMALVLLCSSVYPLYTLNYGNPDFGPIWTSYLGFFLLICAHLAFGMWISSMTSNQMLAFLFTMFGLFILMVLNWIAPNIASAGMAADTVKYIAESTHLESFLKGMLTVADIGYFVCFTVLFLFFTTVVLDSQRWR